MNTPRRTGPLNSLCSPRVATDLAGIDPRDLDALIRSGVVRPEWIKDKSLVDLDDADRAARPREGGDAW